MKAKTSLTNVLGNLGTLIGRGLIAGLAGTVAITLSQWLEKKMNKKPPGFAPADAASKAFGIEASTRETRAAFSRKVHWAYGTTWGIPRALLSTFNVKGLPASAIYFAAIFYTALTIEPDFEVSPPIDEWNNKDITIDALHHLIYVITVGYVFEAINNIKEN